MLLKLLIKWSFGAVLPKAKSKKLYCHTQKIYEKPPRKELKLLLIIKNTSRKDLKLLRSVLKYPKALKKYMEIINLV
jgi:hypothetical protein